MRQPTTLVLAALVVAAVAGPAAAVAAGPADVGAAPAQQDSCTFPYSAVDATGTEVTVDAEPERIVTLAPSAAQTMWEIGAREKVVGVSQYASYLEGADSRRNVTGSGDTWVNLEAVVDSEPDLVLAPNVVPNSTVSRLRDADLTVYKFGPAGTIDDIREKTVLTGALTGECAGAGETADWMDAELSRVESAVEGEDRPRVLYVFFGYTAGEGTFADAIITAAGGRNVAAMANISGYAQISEETVVEYDPQWIMLNDGAPVVPRTEAYNSTTAVRENQTVVITEEYISQPAPRIVNAVVNLTRALHPEAYAATTPVPEPTTQAPTTTAAADSPTPAPETTGDAGPGFGVAVALLAIAGAALLARRER